MKKSGRTFLIAIAVGSLPGLVLLIVGLVAWFRGPDPTSLDPDPELNYELPILFSVVWTVFIFVLISTVMGGLTIIHRLGFRRRMRRLGLMDKHGRWICSPEEAETFERIYG
jgi:Mg/Co/Ni transporter MgtE